jgi:hypothetical protein
VNDVFFAILRGSQRPLRFMPLLVDRGLSLNINDGPAPKKVLSLVNASMRMEISRCLRRNQKKKGNINLTGERILVTFMGVHSGSGGLASL